jgi:outer membrane protein TolC
MFNYKAILIACLLFIFKNSGSQNSLQFSSLDSLFKYAEGKSASIKTGRLQSLLAKWTKIASLGNTINLRSPFTASWTDNTKLPINYLPAEAFGGPPGALKEVSLGQQYVSSYGITPQIDIINPASWARIKSAEINTQLTETNNLVIKKSLFESISATYYNILSFQQQIVYMEQSALAADSILIISKNKFRIGIIREQDVNNASINLLNVQDKLVQLKTTLEQNYYSLKVLCELKPESNIQIKEIINENNNLTPPKAAASSLTETQSRLQTAYLKSELNVSRLTSFSPTLSLIFNQTWQQNSNISFSDAKSYAFTSQYIGLRLNVPFPFDVNRLSQNYTSKINYGIADINVAHSTLQAQAGNKQLDLEYVKAKSTYIVSKQISDLKSINYQKSLNQFIEGIISTDILLTAFTDKINAQLNYTAAFAALKYAESKININNTFQ